MNRLITLTEERLNKAKTPKGGYCKKQLEALGLQWPAKKGWKRGLIGKRISLRRFIAFVAAGKNELYLSEINDFLPKLTPPVSDFTEESESIEPQDNSGKINTKGISKKRIKTAIKRTQKNVERTHKIKVFGVHNAVRLLMKSDLFPKTIATRDLATRLLSKAEYQIGKKDILKLYNAMKSHGVILSHRSNGGITPSKTQVKKQFKASQLLYVIREQGTNHCKIGISKNPSARKRDLQVSNPNTLVISLLFKTNGNAEKLEKSLHKLFSNRNKRGEWFFNISDEEIIKSIGNRGTEVTHTTNK